MDCLKGSQVYILLCGDLNLSRGFRIQRMECIKKDPKLLSNINNIHCNWHYGKFSKLVAKISKRLNAKNSSSFLCFTGRYTCSSLHYPVLSSAKITVTGEVSANKSRHFETQKNMQKQAARKRIVTKTKQAWIILKPEYTFWTSLFNIIWTIFTANRMFFFFKHTPVCVFSFPQKDSFFVIFIKVVFLL